MADDNPELIAKQLPWYRGLSRTQWWILVVASMGWMFDTMDQQFFNLGRGKAMPEVLGVEPMIPGLEKLGEDAKDRYKAVDLDALMAEDPPLLTDRQKGQLLTDRKGDPRDDAGKKDVAKAVGRNLMASEFFDFGKPLLPEKLGSLLLAEKYGSALLSDKEVEGESFDKAALERLGEDGKLDLQVVAEVIEDEGLDRKGAESKTVPRQTLVRYTGKQILLSEDDFGEADLDRLVEMKALSAEAAKDLLADAKDGEVEKKKVLRAVGKVVAEERETFDEASLQALVVLDAISTDAVKELIEESTTGEASKEALTRYFGEEFTKALADKAGGDATTIFVFGWAIGGLFFGWVGDSLGRAKTMALTILTYAIFTGLNGLAQTEFQFNVLRFLTALGVGGEFAAGAALVAESMPERSRAAALGTLQALSAVGNMMGAAIAYFVLPISWRWLFFVGALPGVVAVLVFMKLEEPSKWKDARKKWLEEKAAGVKKKGSSYVGLLQDSRWRKRAIVGLLLGVVGVGGLWGVAFFTPELNRLIAKDYSEEAKEKFVSIAFFLQQFGALLGISAYTVISLKMGRKPAFGVFFALAFLVVSYTFLFATTIWDAYILAPLVGFVTLGPFGGYAIYFPELFPTRLRATGVGFCYNVGRFLAALVPSFKSALTGLLMSSAFAIPFLPAVAGNAERAIRYGSFLMIFIYILGLIVLLFAPETKGKPLPED